MLQGESHLHCKWGLNPPGSVIPVNHVGQFSVRIDDVEKWRGEHAQISTHQNIPQITYIFSHRVDNIIPSTQLAPVGGRNGRD